MVNLSDLPAAPLQLPSQIWLQLAGEAAKHTPEEACGLLSGRGRRVTAIYPIENEQHSPVRFHMEPMAQLHAMIAIEKAGEALLAIYHSHPQGPATPSATDRAEFTYPGTLYLILSTPDGADWKARAFSMDTHPFEEIPLKIE